MKRPIYGQVVVGPPGCGKTTYCNGMQQYLRLLGRETLVINLDPANESIPTENRTTNNNNNHDRDNDNDPETNISQHLPYDTLLDVSEEIINLSSVMEKLELGPNGGLVYCMEYIHHHIDTLLQMLTQRLEEYTTTNNEHPPYLLFDFPGQVELYTHCTCVQNMLHTIAKHLDLRLCSIHLIDAHSCTDAAKFISASLLSTTTMLRLELPTVNVLSKIDLLGQYYSESGMPFNLDFFLECQDLSRLLPYLEGELIGGHHHHHHHQMQSLDDESGNNDPNNNYNNKSLESSMEQEDVEARIMDQDEDYRKARLKTRSTKFYKRHQNMHKELCEVVEDFGLLNFVPLNINDAESVGRLLAKIDKCNGYVFLNNTRTEHHNSHSYNTTTNNYNQNNDTDKIQNKKYSKTDSTPKSQMHDMFQCALQMDKESGYEQVANIQERVLGMFHDSIPELERKNVI